jgi:hypothetical protein
MRASRPHYGQIICKKYTIKKENMATQKETPIKLPEKKKKNTNIKPPRPTNPKIHQNIKEAPSNKNQKRKT